MLLALADYYPLLFLAPFLVFALVRQARQYEVPRGWKLRALAVSLAGTAGELAGGENTEWSSFG